MFQPIVSRATFVVALFAVAACSQAPRDTDQRVSPPPPPAQNQSYLNPGAQPIAPQRAVPGNPGVAQDIVLRGVAYAARGDGRFPPNSTLTLRVYDAGGDINNPVAEQSYTRSGVLPWPYSMNFRTEALAGVRQPTLAGQIQGPNGQLIYRSEQAVALVPGGSEDIPLVAVGAGGGNLAVAPAPAPAAVDPFTGAPIQRGPVPQYGIPDYRSTYGAPTYDAPAYPGQSFEPTSISGPPSNGVF